MKLGKRINDILGMSELIENLSEQGKVPREIRQILRQKYHSEEIPSISTIYNHLNKIYKKRVNEKVVLTGNLRTDVDTVINQLDALIDSIFSMYEITGKDKKYCQSEINFYKSMLRSFLEECVQHDDMCKKWADYWHRYIVDEVILKALEGQKCDCWKKIADAMDEVMENPMNVDIDAVVEKYT